MGKQYNFAMDETDEKLFMEYLKENGYIVYWCGKDGIPKSINRFPDPFSDMWLNVYIYHSAFGDMKFKSYISDEKLNIEKYHIEPISASVIEFGRTVVQHENRRIRPGRIWMQMKYWNENNELVSKSENLNKGYKDIKKWITRNLQKMEQKDEWGKVEENAVSKGLVRLFEEEGYHW